MHFSATQAKSGLLDNVFVLNTTCTRTIQCSGFQLCSNVEYSVNVRGSGSNFYLELHRNEYGLEYAEVRDPY